MLNSVHIKTTIKDYKANIENNGKIALYDKVNNCIFIECTESDYDELRQKLYELNKNENNYTMVVVPKPDMILKSFSWGSFTSPY